MNARPLAVFIVLLSVLGTAWWILQPEAEPVVTSGNRASNQAQSQEVAELDEESAGAEVEIDSGSTEEGDREEIALQHRVLVLDPEGVPQEGVPIVYWGEGQSGQFQELVASLKPGEVPGMEIRESAKRTNPDGQVGFSGDQGFFAWTAWSGFAGWVYVPTDTELGGDPHVLQLHPLHAVELIVLDATGEPVPGRLDFNGHIGPAKELDLQPKDMLPGDYGSSWNHAPNQVFLTADGRRYFELTPPQHSRERLGENPGKLRYRLTFLHNGVQYEPRIFEEDRTEPIVYQLDGTGTLVLHLSGYPEGAMPTLLEQGMDGRPLSGVAVEGSAQQSWEFPGLAIGKRWDVYFTFTAARMSWRSALPPRPISGPESPGERVEAELEFSFPPGFHGRLVSATGDPIEDSEQFGQVQGSFLFASGSQYEDSARGELLPGGVFFMPLQPERRHHQNHAAIRGGELVWRPSKPQNAPEDWAARPQWAFFEATLPNADTSVDVGELVLRQEDPLLLVTVTDQGGRKIRQAAIELQFAADWQSAISERNTFHRLRRTVYTNRQGEAWFVGSDWRSMMYVKRRGDSEPLPNPQIHSLRISAVAEGFHNQSMEIPISQRKVALELAAAASLEGSLLALPEGSHVEVDVVPVGGDAESSLGRSKIRRVSRATTWRFTVEGLEPGTYDVAISFGGGFRSTEVHRVTQVRVDTNGTQDTRLQDIDLRPYLEVTNLRLLHADGTPLSADQVHASNFKVRTLIEGGGGRSPANFDGLHVLLVAVKGSPYERILSGEGWDHLRVDTFGGGTHDVRLQALPRGSIRLLGLDQLPEGVEAAVRVQPDGRGLDGASYDEITVSELPVTWRYPGVHRVTWHLIKNSSGWSKSQTVEFEVSEDVVAEGGSIELAIPQELIEEIPQS